MNNSISNATPPSNTTSAGHPSSNEESSRIFAQLNPQDVEQLYQGYQRWMLQQQMVTLQTQITTLQQQIAENAGQMQQVHLSVIALATLAQFQASGVDDIDLLDSMLERGETWLDHTMQLLEHCERLNVIGESYNQWCKHALEGAYDWIESINEADVSPSSSGTTDAEPFDEVTEELLLQKLMSEDETQKQPIAGRRGSKTVPLHLDSTPISDIPSPEGISSEVSKESIAAAEEPSLAGEATAIIEEVIVVPETSLPVEVEPLPEQVSSVTEEKPEIVEEQEETLPAVDEASVQEPSHMQQETLVTPEMTITPTQASALDNKEQKPQQWQKRSFLRRLLAKIWYILVRNR